MFMDVDSIRGFFNRPPEALMADPEAPAMHQVLLVALETGVIRAAERLEDGTWQANAWVTVSYTHLTLPTIYSV